MKRFLTGGGRLVAALLFIAAAAGCDSGNNLPELEITDIVIGDGAEAVVGSTVTAAYAGFDPEMGGIVDRFFEDRWIDAPPEPGKRGGAFSHGAVPSAHPYILMNYTGRLRDVQTLAHELGHGVHQFLARRRGAGARRVLEGVCLRVLHLFDQRHCVGELRLSLAGKTDDEIARERQVGPRRADALHQPDVFLRRVPPVHRRQHPVRTRLHRQVQIGHQLLHLAVSGDQVVIHVESDAGAEI